MEVILLCIIAYLLGSIPSGVWIGQKFYNKDIRHYGSGNTGATNTFRILGVKAGTLAAIGDILKGTIATFIPIYLKTDIHPILIGLFAILGHVYPIFLKFKGGKAVATTAGVALAIHPLFLFIFVGVFLVILFVTSTVSIASMLGVFLAAIGSLFLGDPIFSGVIWFLAILIIYLHRSNIQRLMKHEESKVPFGMRSSKKNK